MTSFADLVRNITPETYQSFKTAVELGKWANGRPLSSEQRETCLQAMIAWEAENLPESERTGYMPVKCKSSHHDDMPDVVKIRDR